MNKYREYVSQLSIPVGLLIFLKPYPVGLSGINFAGLYSMVYFSGKRKESSVVEFILFNAWILQEFSITIEPLE
ncbi:hypothetical protein J7K43_03210 [Candidatus Calescamantes bacterium]|nr:hypothetical protein [Candidatus Calescamantes bacterium]